eukprot:INCI1021.1.p1 GENE.INCI1021.1~~INCI1021.1.p1  ORF type:complete len:544 (-),score=93.11 INCI1021.1:536-2167(-)
MADDNSDITDVLDCNRAYALAAEVIDDVVDAASEILYDNYVLAKVRNVALDHVMDEIAAALRCVNLPHDVGEQGVVWVPDEDTECAPIDTWGRGAVPLKKKKQSSFLSDIRSSDSPTDRSVGGSRARSRRSGRSRRSSRVKTGDTAATAARPTVILAASPTNARPSTLPKARPKKPVEEKSAEVSALELIQQQEQERIEQLRKEQEEEDARYKALQQELKGKEYTFDADGNLIVIARITADKTDGLAHITAEGRFGIDDAPSAGDIPAAVDAVDEASALAASNQEGGNSSSSRSRRNSERGKAGKSKKRQKTKAGRGSKRAGSKTLDPEHFVADPTKQPPLLSTIRLVPGVTLKEGSANKAGPPKPDDELHMSRSDFSAHQSRLGVASPANSEGESMGNAIALEDLDAVSGARKRNGGGGGGDDEEIKYFDPNVEMMKSGEWGMNTEGDEDYRPALLPERPGSQYMHRMELTLGRTTNKPRDRPHTKMATEPDPSNIKLPPIKQVPAHMKSPRFMKQREDKAFGRTTNRLHVSNRNVIDQLSK